MLREVIRPPPTTLPPSSSTRGALGLVFLSLSLSLCPFASLSLSPLSLFTTLIQLHRKTTQRERERKRAAPSLNRFSMLSSPWRSSSLTLSLSSRGLCLGPPPLLIPPRYLLVFLLLLLHHHHRRRRRSRLGVVVWPVYMRARPCASVSLTLSSSPFYAALACSQLRRLRARHGDDGGDEEEDDDDARTAGKNESE